MLPDFLESPDSPDAAMLLRGLLLLDPGRPPTPGWLRIDGDRIAEVGEGASPGAARPDAGAPDCIITPAFIDAHIHLPQIDSVGADGMELLDWLNRVIYPAESWWGRSGATHMLRTAVRRMIHQGTLGFAGYLTSHGDVNAAATRALASGAGLPCRPRCIVGRVAMDREAPDDLLEHDRWRAGRAPSPTPLLPEPDHGARRPRCSISANPRFAISCTAELLAEIGWTVRDRRAAGAPIFTQTHLAESPAECARVARLFPDAPNYTSVYADAGLLDDRTLLAHCIHLADDEWRCIAERKSVVVHCPTANIFLEAGLFDLDAAREHGVRLALGSDVAAGPDVAMPRVARAMIEMAKLRRMTIAPEAHVPTPEQAWSMITRGNADALGWADAGRLEPGAAADLLILRTPETWLDEHLVGRLIYNWSAELLVSRIVEGRLVAPDTI
ncbi:MAG: hypothetical protein EA376_11440 [Phycisphaeraceae bacterium]|nr:MAG: hypothetical protein EA376_11440 [Phycisphaeraceae bacterium]